MSTPLRCASAITAPVSPQRSSSKSRQGPRFVPLPPHIRQAFLSPLSDCGVGSGTRRDGTALPPWATSPAPSGSSSYNAANYNEEDATIVQHSFHPAALELARANYWMMCSRCGEWRLCNARRPTVASPSLHSQLAVAITDPSIFECSDVGRHCLPLLVLTDYIQARKFVPKATAAAAAVSMNPPPKHVLVRDLKDEAQRAAYCHFWAQCCLCGKLRRVPRYFPGCGNWACELSPWTTLNNPSSSFAGREEDKNESDTQPTQAPQDTQQFFGSAMTATLRDDASWLSLQGSSDVKIAAPSFVPHTAPDIASTPSTFVRTRSVMKKVAMESELHSAPQHYNENGANPKSAACGGNVIGTYHCGIPQEQLLFSTLPMKHYLTRRIGPSIAATDVAVHDSGFSISASHAPFELVSGRGSGCAEALVGGRQKRERDMGVVVPQHKLSRDDNRKDAEQQQPSEKGRGLTKVAANATERAQNPKLSREDSKRKSQQHPVPPSIVTVESRSSLQLSNATTDSNGNSKTAHDDDEDGNIKWVECDACNKWRIYHPSTFSFDPGDNVTCTDVLGRNATCADLCDGKRPKYWQERMFLVCKGAHGGLSAGSSLISRNGNGSRTFKQRRTGSSS